MKSLIQLLPKSVVIALFLIIHFSSVLDSKVEAEGLTVIEESAGQNDSSSCCVGSTGNIDCDPNDITDITDLTVLIDHLFLSLSPLCCPAEANIDGAGPIDITDLTVLIDHLFLSLAPTVNCAQPISIPVVVDGLMDGDCVSDTIKYTISAVNDSLVTLVAFLNDSEITLSGIIESEGIYQLLIIASDTIGNIDSVVFNFSIDRTPPTILVAISDTLRTNQATTLNAICEDANSTESWSYLNGSVVQLPTTVISEGNYELLLVCEDCAGNIDSSTSNLQIDKTSPVLDMSSTIDTTTSTIVIIQGTIVESNPEALYRNGTLVTIAPDGSFRDTVSLVEGKNVLSYLINDMFGNSDSTTLEVVRDNTPPIIRINPIPYLVSADSFIVSGSIFDQSGLMSSSMDSSSIVIDSFGQFESYAQLTRDTGLQRVWVSALDNLGNKADTFIDVSVFVSPMVDISTPSGSRVTISQGGLSSSVVSVSATDVTELELEALLGIQLTNPSEMIPDTFLSGQFFLPAAVAVSITTDTSIGGLKSAVQRIPDIKIPNITGVDQSVPLWIFKVIPDLDGDGQTDLTLISRAAVSDDGMTISPLPPDSKDDPFPGLYSDAIPFLDPSDLSAIAPQLVNSINAQIASATKSSQVSASTSIKMLQTRVDILCCAANAVTPVKIVTNCDGGEDVVTDCGNVEFARQKLAEFQAIELQARTKSIQAGDRFGGVDDGRFAGGDCIKSIGMLHPEIGLGAGLFLTAGDWTSQAIAPLVAVKAEKSFNDVALNPKQKVKDINSLTIAYAAKAAEIKAKETGVPMWSKMKRAFSDYFENSGIKSATTSLQEVKDLQGLVGTPGDDLILNVKIKDQVVKHADRIKKFMNVSKGIKVGGFLLGLKSVYDDCSKSISELNQWMDARAEVPVAKSQVKGAEAAVESLEKICQKAKDCRGNTPPITMDTHSYKSVSFDSVSTEDILSDSMWIQLYRPGLEEAIRVGDSLILDLELVMSQLNRSDSIFMTPQEAYDCFLRTVDFIERLHILTDEEGINPDPVQSANDAKAYGSAALLDSISLQNAIEENSTALSIPITSINGQPGTFTSINGDSPTLFGISDSKGRGLTSYRTSAIKVAPGDSANSPGWLLKGRTVEISSFLRGNNRQSFVGLSAASAPDISFEGQFQTLTLDIVADAGSVLIEPVVTGGSQYVSFSGRVIANLIPDSIVVQGAIVTATIFDPAVPNFAVDSVVTTIDTTDIDGQFLLDSLLVFSNELIQVNASWNDSNGNMFTQMSLPSISPSPGLTVLGDLVVSKIPCGDANGDGNYNNADVSYLLDWINGAGIPPSVAADVDNFEGITYRDILVEEISLGFNGTQCPANNPPLNVKVTGFDTIAYFGQFPANQTVSTVRLFFDTPYLTSIYLPLRAEVGGKSASILDVRYNLHLIDMQYCLFDLLVRSSIRSSGTGVIELISPPGVQNCEMSTPLPEWIVELDIAVDSASSVERQINLVLDTIPPYWQGVKAGIPMIFKSSLSPSQPVMFDFSTNPNSPYMLKLDSVGVVKE